jgi:3-dehydro-L-gulonate 2-dehydrogenase
MYSKEKNSTQPEPLLIPHRQMESTFFQILKKLGFKDEQARSCARIFMENSLDGVYSHGVNRFPHFIEHVQKGFVKAGEKAIQKSSNGAIEQWDGRLGPGPLNALQCTDRAMALAKHHGMGCIGLSNTNHWMRGGTYGWKAAKAGYIFIGWTNTIANMPAWGAANTKIGNNPLVLAAPYQNEAVVLDMAMSQFSYGALSEHELNEEPLLFPGGYNKEGQLSTDPSAVLETGRILPAGYWKGAGLSLLLDILGTLISGGLSTAEISKRSAEYGVSQVFIAISTSNLPNSGSIQQVVKRIIDDYHSSIPDKQSGKVRFPGEGSLQNRQKNLAKGIPVNKLVWEEIEKL